MKLCCPHCHRDFELNVGKLIGHARSKAKAAASRLNGATGGRPIAANPVRLRPHHPGHPKHAEWLKEQAAKRLPPDALR